VNAITSIAVNQSADWVALGSSATGALCVWEWQSESFQLKQQSHFGSMACLSYSPDGQYIATGGDDAKVSYCPNSSGGSISDVADSILN
jgi:periodic tryptophan protein 2